MIDGTNYLINICIQELNFPEKDVEQLLVSLILDNRIQGHIDQVNKLLERGERCRAPNLFYTVLYFVRSDWDVDLFGLSQVQGDEEVQCHRQVEYSAEVHLPNIVQQSLMRRIAAAAACIAHLELLIACFVDLRATAKNCLVTLAIESWIWVKLILTTRSSLNWIWCFDSARLVDWSKPNSNIRCPSGWSLIAVGAMTVFNLPNLPAHAER